MMKNSYINTDKDKYFFEKDYSLEFLILCYNMVNKTPCNDDGLVKLYEKIVMLFNKI